MSFFTHILRIDNIFYFGNEIIVGTDSFVVSVISNENLKPQIDIDNSVSFLMNGYFADEIILFKDVSVMPSNSVMTVSIQGIKVDELYHSYNELFTEKPNKIINDQIKENYIEAFKAVPNKVDINIGVTGGKGSRLALLDLLVVGYNIKTNTRRFKDNPDVQMAQKLTEKLRLEHKVIEPKIMSIKSMTVNIEKRVLQSMAATIKQVYGYEVI